LTGDVPRLTGDPVPLKVGLSSDSISLKAGLTGNSIPLKVGLTGDVPRLSPNAWLSRDVPRALTADAAWLPTNAGRWSANSSWSAANAGLKLRLSRRQ
jgi:hypothetical protein